MGRSWSDLVSSMGDLGAILVPLGATWGVSWSLLRPSWGYLERSWVVLGPSWGDVVPVGEAKNIGFPVVFVGFRASVALLSIYVGPT